MLSVVEDELIVMGDKVIKEYDDKILNIQEQAQIKMWLKKKEDISFVKKIMKYELDPYISNNRDVWILVCRILKTISKGGIDLLECFTNWTKMVKPHGEIRSKSCIKAWNLQRPVTNCDFIALIKARIFLRERDYDESSFIITNDGKLEIKPDLLNNTIDPMVTSLLDTISNVMLDKSIFFIYDKFDKNILINNDDKNNENSKKRQILVPVAIYEIQHLNFYDIDNNKLDINEIDNNIENYFLWNDSANASISKGDVIYHQLLSLPKKYSKWNCCRVLSIDLLFARLRVVACPPPPYCWYPHDTLAPIWMDVSLLWNKTVASLLLPDDTNSIKYSRYMIFVTPIPCTIKAIELLSSLTHLNTSYNNKYYHNIKSISNNDNIKTKKIKIMNQIENGLSLILQQEHLDTILKWKIINKKKTLHNSLLFHAKISIVNEGEIEWKEIYLGRCNACQISGLLPNVIYQCSVTAIYTSNNIKNNNKKNIISSDIFFQLKDKHYIKL